MNSEKERRKIMKKLTIDFILAVIMCIILAPHAIAAQVGDTSISDEKGTNYILSEPIIGTTSLTFWDDMETTNTCTVTVYLVPKDTIITLPDNVSQYFARWYIPDEYSRGGWGIFAENLIAAGTALPFDSPTISPDGIESSTGINENSTLRLYSLDTYKSIYVRGVDSQGTDSQQNAVGMGNFKKTASYPGFFDVQDNDWYAGDVKQAYELGLMSGKGAGKFDPSGTLTLAEAITIAARINAIYQGTSFSSGGDPWYSNAVTYSITHKIIPNGRFSDFTKLATRTEFAHILYKSIPSTEFQQINQVNKIPDVALGEANSESIYTLYRAGILTGSNDGSFNPNNSINRAEAAAIINRVVLPQNRITHSTETDATSKEDISSASGNFTITASKETDWRITKDEVNTKNGVYEFFYQSKTGCATMRIFVLPKSSFPSASALSAATAMKNDCIKQGSTISDKGLYSSSIANYSGSAFDYIFVNDKGVAWKGKFTFFETSNHIYGVQQETSDSCSESDQNNLSEIVSSLKPISD